MVTIVAVGKQPASQRLCVQGLYGDKCQYQCSGNCADKVPCDARTGICPEGCSAGWKGKLCDKGTPGKYQIQRAYINILPCVINAG
jgi:hypothetical protein